MAKKSFNLSLVAARQKQPFKTSYVKKTNTITLRISEVAASLEENALATKINKSLSSIGVNHVNRLTLEVESSMFEVIKLICSHLKQGAESCVVYMKESLSSGQLDFLAKFPRVGFEVILQSSPRPSELSAASDLLQIIQVHAIQGVYKSHLHETFFFCLGTKQGKVDKRALTCTVQKEFITTRTHAGIKLIPKTWCLEFASISDALTLNQSFHPTHCALLDTDITSAVEVTLPLDLSSQMLHRILLRPTQSMRLSFTGRIVQRNKNSFSYGRLCYSFMRVHGLLRIDNFNGNEMTRNDVKACLCLEYDRGIKNIEVSALILRAYVSRLDMSKAQPNQRDVWAHFKNVITV